MYIPPASVDGYLMVKCWCQRATVLASTSEVRHGVRLSCGREFCDGLPAERTTRRIGSGGPPATGSKARCGTENGYRKHIRDRTPSCVACRQAHAIYGADKKHRRRERANSVQ